MLEGSQNKIISDDRDSKHELQHTIHKTDIALVSKARIVESEAWHDENSEKSIDYLHVYLKWYIFKWSTKYL